MGALYSKKKKRERDNVTNQDRAVLDLKNSRDRLTRYQKRLDLECTKLQAQALSMVKDGRKDRALLLLKVKKLKQDQADKASSQLLTVHQLMETIDWESQQLKVFDALKEGNLALNKLHEEMPLEKVEKLMADTAESIAMEEEISKAIGGSWTDANEEDLLAELAVLEGEEEKEKEEAAAAKPVKVPVVVEEQQPAAVTAAPAPVAVTDGAVEQAGNVGQWLEELLPEAPTDAVIVEPAAQADAEEVTDQPVLVPA